MKIRHNAHFFFKNSGDVENTSAQYTRQTKRCHDVRLSRQEGGTRCHLGSAQYWDRPAGQDVFFWCLAGQSAPTGLAIVHWIGCINAIKYQHPTPYGFRDIAQTRFYRQGHYSKVKSRSHHDVAHLQLLTNVPTKYQFPTLYGFRDIARTRFYRQGHYSKVTL